MSKFNIEERKGHFLGALIEWAFWMAGSLAFILIIKWCTQQYGTTQYEIHVWVSATLYLWYVSTMSLLVGSTYFVARAAQTQLERRQSHPARPDKIDLTADLERIQRIKKRSAITAIVVHLINAGFVFYISRHIPGITPEFRIYAVLGVFAIAAIKPAFTAINAIRAEIFGMQVEADYPVKTVADLWLKIHEFGNYEKRLEKVFERINEVTEAHDTQLEDQLKEVETQLQSYKEELNESFATELTTLKASDGIRQSSYNELKEAQLPITKEIGKVLSSIQSLKDYVIELRDKNIKGEQLMSALKEFGIDSLADLNVTFQKSVADRNPRLKNSDDTSIS